MAEVPDGWDYRDSPSVEVFDTDDLSPEVIGVLLDHRGNVLRVLERERRMIGF